MLFFPLSESDKAPHYIYPSNPNGSKLQTVTITMWVIQALAQCSPRRYLMSNTYDYLWYFLENLVMLSKTVYAFLQRKGLYTPKNRFLITSKNKLDSDLHGHHGFSSKSKNLFFYFWKFSNSDERSAIGWIERKTKFQIFPIFIFRVMVILATFLWKNHSNFQW